MIKLALISDNISSTGLNVEISLTVVCVIFATSVTISKRWQRVSAANTDGDAECKAEKFAKKDLAKLQATVMRDVLNNKDTEMADIVTVKTASELKDQQSTSAEDGQMEIEGVPAKTYNKKKKTDEHGQYPVWMNKRAVRKQQQKNKKIKRKKGRKAAAK